MVDIGAQISYKVGKYVSQHMDCVRDLALSSYRIDLEIRHMRENWPIRGKIQHGDSSIARILIYSGAGRYSARSTKIRFNKLGADLKS